MTKPPFFLFAGCLLLFAISAYCRVVQFDDSQRWFTNQDAPYHVLAIMKAWDATPPSVHHYLPLMSFGNPMDKNIPWGRLLPSRNGNFYYISFPPLGFLVPYFVDKAAGFPPSLFSLLVFNLGVHFVATVLLLILIWRCIRFLPGSTAKGTYGWLLLVAATYLFAREPYYAHGGVYWSQSLFQVAWFAQLICFWNVIDARRTCNLSVCGLLAASFLAPSIEWTGYLSTGSVTLGLLFLAYKNKDKHLFWLALSTSLCALLAAAVFAIQCLSILGQDEAINYLLSRMLVRSIHGKATMHDYLIGLFDSFGLFSIVGVGAAAIFMVRWRKISGPLPVFLAVMTVPLAENILMLQHAITYKFDRLKIIVPILVVISVLGALSSIKNKRILAAVWLLCIASNIYLLTPYGDASFNPRITDAHEGIAQDRKTWAVARQFDKPCTLFTYSGIVRGYYNSLTERSIYEAIPSADRMKSLTKERAACLGVWFTSTVTPRGWWDMIYVYDPKTDEMRMIETRL